MTALTKLFFSFVLLIAGFGLASMFGPPELADRFADSLRPVGPTAPPGALQPSAMAVADPDDWAQYEAAASFDAPIPYGGMPEPVLSEAPRWTTARPVDGLASVPRLDASVAPAVASSDSAGGPVTASGWREPTAPVGWRTQAQPSQAPVSPPGPPPRQDDWPGPDWSTDANDRSPPARAWSPGGVSQYSPTNFPLPGSSPPAASPEIGPPPAAQPGGWGANRTDATPVKSVAAPSPWSLDARTRPAVPALPLAGVTPIGPDEPAPREPVRHVIGDGDTLPRLAARYLGDASRAGEIYAANRSTLLSPDLLPIGVEVVITPSPPTAEGLTPVGQSVGQSVGAVGVQPHAQLLGPQPLAPPSGFVGLGP